MNVEGKTFEQTVKEAKLATMGRWLLATYKGKRVAVLIETITQVIDMEGFRIGATECSQWCELAVKDKGNVFVDQTADEVVQVIAWHGCRLTGLGREEKGGGR